MHFQKLFDDFQRHPPFGWALVFLFVMSLLTALSLLLMSKTRGKINDLSNHQNQFLTPVVAPPLLFHLIGIPFFTFLAFSILHSFIPNPSFEFVFCNFLLSLIPSR